MKNNKHVLFAEKILLIIFGLFILLTNVVRQYQFEKMTAVGEKKLTTQLVLLKHA